MGEMRKDVVVLNHDGTIEVLPSEYVQYNEKGEIVNCSFDRLNFDEPASILGYCGDVKEKISGVLHSTSELAIASERIVLDANIVDSVTSFDDSLDASEAARNKKELAIVKGFKNLLSNLGVQKYQEEDKMKTYQGRFEAYCDEIKIVVEAVEAQRQACLNDMELRTAIIDKMTPLVEQLGVMVEVGYKDLETYQGETNALASQTSTNGVSDLVDYRSRLAQAVEFKLHELAKALALYNAQIQSYRVQQLTDMQQVMQAQSYITDQAPVLEAQGSIQVFNRLQAERQNMLDTLNERTNAAIARNAQELEQNVQATVEASLKNGISLETLKAVDGSLRRGVELFKEGRSLKQAQVRAQRSEIAKINSSLNDYQEELNRMITDDDNLYRVLNSKSSGKFSPRYTTKKGLRA